MSVGFFMGVCSSYINEAQDAAQSLLKGINRGLSKLNLPEYIDPTHPPDVYVKHLFGRSALDHHGASLLIEIGELAEEHNLGPHLVLVAANPYRVVFLPYDFPEPFDTTHQELLASDYYPVWAGSSQRLLGELLKAAPHLGIPLASGELPDAVADKINEFEPLFEGDSDAGAESRSAWLVLHEGARLAAKHNVALSLAG